MITCPAAPAHRVPRAVAGLHDHRMPVTSGTSRRTARPAATRRRRRASTCRSGHDVGVDPRQRQLRLRGADEVVLTSIRARVDHVALAVEVLVRQADVLRTERMGTVALLCRVAYAIRRAAQRAAVARRVRASAAPSQTSLVHAWPSSGRAAGLARHVRAAAEPVADVVVQTLPSSLQATPSGTDAPSQLTPMPSQVSAASHSPSAGPQRIPTATGLALVQLSSPCCASSRGPPEGPGRRVPGAAAPGTRTAPERVPGAAAPGARTCGWSAHMAPRTSMQRPVFLFSMDTEQFFGPPMTTGALKAYFLAHGRTRDGTDVQLVHFRDRADVMHWLAVEWPERIAPLARQALAAGVQPVFGLSCYTWNVAEFLTLARTVKRELPDALVVAGGPHVQRAEDFLIEDGIDVVVLGEGEKTFTDAARRAGPRELGRRRGLRLPDRRRRGAAHPAARSHHRSRRAAVRARRPRAARRRRRAALRARRLRDQPRLPVPLLVLRVGHRRHRHQDVPVLARRASAATSSAWSRAACRTSGSATRTSARSRTISRRRG